MVRITVDDGGPTLHLKIEGRLIGAWVTELEQCWRKYSALWPERHMVVDLTKTEAVDLAGKYLLALMHRSGVEFTASSPYMSALLAEIARPEAAVKPGTADHPSKGAI